MSKKTFKIGDDVHINEPGDQFDGMDGRIAHVASGALPYRVDTSGGSDWYDAKHLTINEHKPQRDAIPPQPAPSIRRMRAEWNNDEERYEVSELASKLQPVVREMETAAAKIGMKAQEEFLAQKRPEPMYMGGGPAGAADSRLIEAARASLPVQREIKIQVDGVVRDTQPGDIEILANGAKQSKLGHWWSTPYAALAVARVMSEGHTKYDQPGTTPAQGNWHGIPVWSNIQHAITHLMLYAIHDKSEDHLAHAATRLMMALDQRESGREKS